MLRPESVARFSPAVASALDDLRLDVTTTPIPVAVERIRYGTNKDSHRPLIGSDGVHLQTLVVSGASSSLSTRSPTLQVSMVDFRRPCQIQVCPTLPTGQSKPVGMADLLVVKHQLVR